MLSDEIELLEWLSRYSLEFGILDEDGETLIPIVSKTEEEETRTSMKTKDAMYFTEYGTFSIPGRFLLDKCLPLVNLSFDAALEKLSEEILEGRKDKAYIDVRMKEIALRIQDIVRNYVFSYPEKENVIGKILGKEGETTKEICDLKELSKRIKCKAKFKY